MIHIWTDFSLEIPTPPYYDRRYQDKYLKHTIATGLMYDASYCIGIRGIDGSQIFHNNPSLYSEIMPQISIQSYHVWAPV